MSGTTSEEIRLPFKEKDTNRNQKLDEIKVESKAKETAQVRLMTPYLENLRADIVENIIFRLGTLLK
jgi:hypothetical protein